MAKKDPYYVVATENHPGRTCTWATDARDLKDAERIKNSVEKTGGYPKGSTARIVKR
ncbi:hypothetical protein QTQ03_26550 [Micromonospora sp. WMMA1363]|uniref:hypothetical protein n=1 Tax=Micromonospora sp. WMMA1363 TaxID=3053985 RepID=UPI00259C7930|nr:hypothetical protein [Micromonospora sp. WMMA1363]MDM4720129.1 hypothetical protein [Micromonospora sp. WMMA1363]MDM4722989.1 hypothetical protein [Micromonospora sp. WMMA1363]